MNCRLVSTPLLLFPLRTSSRGSPDQNNSNRHGRVIFVCTILSYFFSLHSSFADFFEIKNKKKNEKLRISEFFVLHSSSGLFLR